jgi:hypothetical protein
MLRLGVFSALTTVLAILASPASAQNSQNVKAGVLSCHTSGNVGLIIGSRQRLSCQFTPNEGPPENYAGRIDRLGIDLGVTHSAIITWAVFAPTAGVLHGALAGHYSGTSGDISFGLGGGYKILLGGWKRSIALQPLAVVGQVGVNVAWGIAGLTLTHVH